MQSLLIQYILNPLCRLTGRLSENQKDRLFVLGGLGIVLLTFLRHSEAVSYRYLFHYVGCCLGLGMMILGTLGQEVKPVRFRKVFTLIWFIYGGLQLVSGLRNSSNYLPEAMLLLVAYPVVFICWNNADRGRIYRLLNKILRRSLVVFAAASWLFSPISLSKYPGIFTNTNNASYYLCLVVVSSLLALIYGESKGKEFWKTLVTLGLSVSLNYYTNSRTGTLAIFLALAFALVIYIPRNDRAAVKACLSRLGIGLLVSVLCVFCLVGVFFLRQYLPLPYFDAEDLGIYMAEEDEDFEQKHGHFLGIKGFSEISNQKNNAAGKDLDAYSTGRVSIWLAYAQDLNMTGHPGVPPKYIASYNKEFESTHMTCLQIAYESGIPAGLLFLLINILSGIHTLSYGWKRGREDYALAPLMFTVVFGVLSMLGSCVASFGYLTTFLYYLSQYPILASLPEEKK